MSSTTSTRDPELADEVARRNLRRFLVLDLLTGRVDRSIRCIKWVSDYGISELDLDWFSSNPQTPDVAGTGLLPQFRMAAGESGSAIRQRRSENAAGVYGIGSAYYNRYGLPLMLTETSTDGKPINREIWLEKTIEDCRRLRAEGIPMLGYFWWPLFDQIDWDGALTHRVGKIHEVGSVLPASPARRHARPRCHAAGRAIFTRGRGGNERVGELESIAMPAGPEQQDRRFGTERASTTETASACDRDRRCCSGQLATRSHPAAEPPIASHSDSRSQRRDNRPYGIVVFSHLRWGFVWQRPQQFLSRFARKHRILFVEEPSLRSAGGRAIRDSIFIR